MTAVLAVTTDLIFATKIVGTAKALGVTASSAGNPQALATRLATGDVSLVFVDMDLPPDFASQAITTAHDRNPRPTVVAYYSHVRGDLAQLAQNNGADEILTRSQLVAKLPSLLQGDGENSHESH